MIGWRSLQLRDTALRTGRLQPTSFDVLWCPLRFGSEVLQISLRGRGDLYDIELDT